MVRPLLKHYKNGTLYKRRPEVEAEISALESLDLSELEKRSKISAKNSDGYISVEALLYFVRITSSKQFHDGLLTELLRRFHRLLPRPDDAGNQSASMTKSLIREAVNDNFTDKLLSDQQEYNDKLDYFEINFNHAVLRDKRDAQSKYWRLENQQQTIETEADDIEILDASDGHDYYEPLSPEEFDKIIYRPRLESAITELSDIRQLVIEMWLNGIPAGSINDSVITMSKLLGVNEKTARTHLKTAFEILRKKLEFPGQSK